MGLYIWAITKPQNAKGNLRKFLGTRASRTQIIENAGMMPAWQITGFWRLANVLQDNAKENIMRSEYHEQILKRNEV